MSITVNDLQDSYTSATKNNGLITLTETLRENDRIRHQELRSLFENLADDWKSVPNSSGHVSFKNKVTEIVVSFQGHSGGRSDPTVKKIIADQVLENVQLHLNILNNIIFSYTDKNWEQPPRNYSQCLRRYEAWIKDGKPLEEASEEKASASLDM